MVPWHPYDGQTPRDQTGGTTMNPRTDLPAFDDLPAHCKLALRAYTFALITDTNVLATQAEATTAIEQALPQHSGQSLLIADWYAA